MTLEKLRRLRIIDILIKRAEEKVIKAEEAADLHGISYDYRPRSTSIRNVTEETAEKIIKAKQELAEREAEKVELLEFINSIDDALAKVIFELYFIERKNWNEVADYIDNGSGKTSDDSVKKICYRVLEKSEKNK